MNSDGPIHHFDHEAMHSTFSLRLADCAAETAGYAAREFFRELDRLEEQLSRFREDSDISRINVLRPGDTLHISEACHACLLEAAEAHDLTGGLFDITIGASIRHLKEGGTCEAISEKGQLMVDPDQAAVACLEEGCEMDLGGIAKGFALDWLAPLLDEWGIPSALLAAGRSTLLARGSRSWPVGTSAQDDEWLCRSALGVSGDAVQGTHVLHPRAKTSCADSPITAHRVWLTHKRAAMADALSTAALLVPLTELSGSVASWGATLVTYTSKGDV